MCQTAELRLLGDSEFQAPKFMQEDMNNYYKKRQNFNLACHLTA
jgi:hypothetical protein